MENIITDQLLSQAKVIVMLKGILNAHKDMTN